MSDFIKNLFLGLMFGISPELFKKKLTESKLKVSELEMVERIIMEQIDKANKFLEIVKQHKDEQKGKS